MSGVTENWALGGVATDETTGQQVQAFWTGQINVRRSVGFLQVRSAMTPDAGQALVFFTRAEAEEIRARLTLDIFQPLLLETSS